MRRLPWVFLSSLVLMFVLARNSYAAGSCTFSVDPNFVAPSTSTSLNVSINNTGSENISWIQIVNQNPSAINVTSSNSYGWVSVDALTLTGTLNGGSGAQYSFDLTSGPDEGMTSVWKVLASPNQDGSNSYQCDGSVTLLVSNSAPANPVMTNISLGVAATSATVSWTTDIPTTATVTYGKTADMGASKTDTQSTSHSIVLDGLDPLTTYYYRIESKNVTSLSTITDLSTFTTGTIDTVVNTETVTQTVTETVTQTETKNVIIKDTTPPTVKITPLSRKTYVEAPEITGQISDDRGVAYLEYSLDQSNWVKSLTDGKIGAKLAGFSVLPGVTDDGTYNLYVRGTDTSGNVSRIKVVNFVIDKYPPVVGPGLIYSGGLILYPDKDGVVDLLSGMEMSVVVPESGGSEEVALVVNNQRFNLSKEASTGLWRGKLLLTGQGKSDVFAEAKDGAGNKTNRQWLTVNVLPAGKVKGDSPLQGAEIKVFVYDENSLGYIMWDGEAYGQSNPVSTDKVGEYRLVLPSGKYYILVSTEGKPGLVSSIFNIDKAQAINFDWQMASGSFSLADTVRYFSGLRKEVLVSPRVYVDIDQGLKGKLWDMAGLVGDKDVQLSDWQNKVNWIQITHTSMPDAAFLYLLNKDWLSSGRAMRLVGLQESYYKVLSFANKSGMQVTPLADPQASLLDKLPLWTLPVNVFLDRNGKIIEIKQGLVNRQDLLDNW